MDCILNEAVGMLRFVYLLIVLYSCCFYSSSTLKLKRSNSQKIKNPPLTDHLLKCVNDIDGKIIGFHLVLPNDENLLRDYLQKPSEDVEKLLEFLIQINHLRNIIENDNTISLKRRMNNGIPSDIKYDRNMDLANLMTPQSELIFLPDKNQNLTTRPVARSLYKYTNGLKSPKDCVLIISKHRSNPGVYNSQNAYRYDYGDNKMSHNGTVTSPKDLMKELMKISGNSYLNVFPLITFLQKNDSIDYLTGKLNRSQQELCILGHITPTNDTHSGLYNKIITIEPFNLINSSLSNFSKQTFDKDSLKLNKTISNDMNSSGSVISFGLHDNSNQDNSTYHKPNYVQPRGKKIEIDTTPNITQPGLKNVTNSTSSNIPIANMANASIAKGNFTNINYSNKNYVNTNQANANYAYANNVNTNYTNGNNANTNYAYPSYGIQNLANTIIPNIESTTMKFYQFEEIKNSDILSSINRKALKLSHNRHRREISGNYISDSYNDRSSFKPISYYDNSFINRYDQSINNNYAPRDNILMQHHPFTDIQNHAEDGSVNYNTRCRDKLLNILSHARTKREVNENQINDKDSSSINDSDEKTYLNKKNSSWFNRRDTISQKIKKFRRLQRMLNLSSFDKGNGSRSERSIFMMPHTPGFLNVVIGYPDKSDLGNPRKKMEKLFARRRLLNSALIANNQDETVDKTALDAILKDPQTYQNLILKLGSSTSNFVDEKSPPRSQNQGDLDKLISSPINLSQLRKNVRFMEGEKFTLPNNNYSVLLPNVNSLGNNINKLAEGLQNTKDYTKNLINRHGSSSDSSNRRIAPNPQGISPNVKANGVASIDSIYSTTYEELLPANEILLTNTEAGVSLTNVQSVPANWEDDNSLTSNCSIDDSRQAANESSVISTTEYVKYYDRNNEFFSIMQYYNTEGYNTVGTIGYQQNLSPANATEVSFVDRNNSMSAAASHGNVTNVRQHLVKTTTSSGSEYFRTDKNESATCNVNRSSNETTEEPEENDDYADGEVMPFISVNIFPIMNWKKKQDKAGISLVKDLVAKSAQPVQEEPALPTYLSDLLELLGDHKKNQTTQYESVQRRLESILTGKVSNNDLLKFKLLNILHKSNKFERLNSRSKEIS